MIEILALFAFGAVALAYLSDRKKRRKAAEPPAKAEKCIRCAQTPIMSRVEADRAIRDASARSEQVATVALTLGAYLAYQGVVDEPDEEALLSAKKTCADLGLEWNF